VPVPFVTIKITRDGVTAEQKACSVAEVTATLQAVLGKKPEHTHIVIDEVDPENWGYAGVLTTEYRQQHPAG
jgi:4-oxalocrotonate tautomerase